jgi:hypothetical protein
LWGEFEEKCMMKYERRKELEEELEDKLEDK